MRMINGLTLDSGDTVFKSMKKLKILNIKKITLKQRLEITSAYDPALYQYTSLIRVYYILSIYILFNSSLFYFSNYYSHKLE